MIRPFQRLRERIEEICGPIPEAKSHFTSGGADLGPSISIPRSIINPINKILGSGMGQCLALMIGYALDGEIAMEEVSHGRHMRKLQKEGLIIYDDRRKLSVLDEGNMLELLRHIAPQTNGVAKTR